MIQPHKPSEIISFLKNNKINPKKSLSQNFLIDANIVDKIINEADLEEEDTVLEIGPGPGILTYALLEKNVNVIAIEKDTFFANELKKNPSNNLKVFEEDFLKFNLSQLKTNNKIKVVANLPYNITFSILEHLFDNYDLFSLIVIMLQKETAKRLLISENNKNYRFSSLMVHYFSETKYCFSVSKNCFFPKPNVDSAIIALRIKDSLPFKNSSEFLNVAKTLFQNKRKKAISSLKHLFPDVDVESIFNLLNIDINIRPQDIALEKLIEIFKLITKKAS